MSKQTINVISIISLSLGSILMLAAGSGFISAQYPFVTGLICFMVFGLIEVISRINNRR
jgi:hypothetical protein